jgi:hypothetical protein
MMDEQGKRDEKVTIHMEHSIQKENNGYLSLVKRNTFIKKGRFSAGYPPVRLPLPSPPVEAVDSVRHPSYPGRSRFVRKA